MAAAKGELKSSFVPFFNGWSFSLRFSPSLPKGGKWDFRTAELLRRVQQNSPARNRNHGRGTGLRAERRRVNRGCKAWDISSATARLSPSGIPQSRGL